MKFLPLAFLVLILTACDNAQVAGVIQGTVSPSEAAQSQATPEAAVSPSPAPFACPTGMDYTGPKSCIETLSHGPSNFSVAEDHCTSQGYDFCSASQVGSAETAKVVTKDTELLMTSTVVSSSLIMGAINGYANQPIPAADKYYYRCCK